MKFQASTDNQTLLVQESLLSTANGYIGIRGNFEEGYGMGDETIRGTYINAFHEVVDLAHGEPVCGFPQTAQKMLNVVDGQTIRIKVDGDLFSLDQGRILEVDRELDLEKGVAVRSVRWRSPKGHEMEFLIHRMTSFVQKELFLIDYSIRSVDDKVEIQIESTLDGDVQNHPGASSGQAKLLHVREVRVEDKKAVIRADVERAGLSMAAAMAHDVPMSYRVGEQAVEGIHRIVLGQGESFRFSKYVAYADSLRHPEPVAAALEILEEALSRGSGHWHQAQEAYLADFWRHAAVRIDGNPDAQEAVAFSTYQLLSSAGKDPHSSLPAKGLTGEGNGGQYSWDTEIFALPVFTLVKPDVARNLLAFRHTGLDAAKEEARLLGHAKGAKIPWRTISGSECSTCFPAGQAQYHINADVAYAHIQHHLHQGDVEFLLQTGYEVVLETARLWMETGHFGASDGKFRIDAVTGPDEYTALVDNNYFTNAMAQYHLHWTAKLAGILREADGERWEIILSCCTTIP
ncbi:glycoside hydrolase family 65 protein [Anaerotalea alkaliphila]|uniref:Glycoside hydrolase family 65 protein n=1 Tax=Anaerotalea alkaliphila TaxID=2662126 RepID=A0A7X5HWL2_9FIRM|nr:glycoside hydrolase family 65 protein [Anaerotalea alkaliphila]NDL68019.1 glycoside hydrolase family 65 protein [Anaerotalea alkaliphila]